MAKAHTHYGPNVTTRSSSGATVKTTDDGNCYRRKTFSADDGDHRRLLQEQGIPDESCSCNSNEKDGASSRQMGTAATDCSDAAGSAMNDGERKAMENRLSKDCDLADADAFESALREESNHNFV